MSLDVPYERLGTATKVDYIPLKLALTDLPENNISSSSSSSVDDYDNNDKNKTLSTAKNQRPKVDIDLTDRNLQLRQPSADLSKQQFYNSLVLGLLTFFCVLVLLYAIFYFVILRDRQKSIVKPSYMF
ncbi:ORF81 [Spodoptera exigua multiple nucleopolyhedrovirus]|uniref:ORF81 n=1 Tax=Spodoptera exigua nuclear polyhedrosis virus (strain US) TaxID=31506 RepID=Q9J856_NPVSE|nr:ORF81 [Spodoptera exigua multiple nucleopolyhedrovirus]AAF33610.1 ORF81 [Spodoptera exigua multiple nucleopolyhedrovirus]